MATNERTLYLKVPILGHTNAGKSTLFNFFRTRTKKQFTFKANDFLLLENIQYKNFTFHIQIWDAWGYKELSTFQGDLFQKSSVAIVLYDVSDMTKNSYRDVSNWIHRLWNENGRNKIPFLIIGNKIDLRNAKRPTLSLFDCSDLASKYTRECNLRIPQIEISAYSKENCEQILPLICDIIISTLDFPIQPFN